MVENALFLFVVKTKHFYLCLFAKALASSASR